MYRFILLCKYRFELVTEAVFLTHHINQSSYKSFCGSDEEKRKILQDIGMLKQTIERIMEEDKIIPIWGIIEAIEYRKDNITRIEKFPEDNPKKITIYTDMIPAGITFYREKI